MEPVNQPSAEQVYSAQLARECAEAPVQMLRVHHATQRLADDFGARSVVVLLLRSFSLDQIPRMARQVHSSLDAPAAAAARRWQGADAREDLFMRRLMERCERAFADDRSDCPVCSERRGNLVPDSEWFAHPFYRSYVRPVGIAYVIASVCRLGRETGRGYLLSLLNREARHGPFTNEQVMRMHEVISTLAPMVVGDLRVSDEGGVHEGLTREEMESRLSDAERRVLPLLLSPLNEAEIAVRLNRSAHTVHSHVRRIFTVYSVRSRFELMHRYMSGRGGA